MNRIGKQWKLLTAALLALCLCLGVTALAEKPEAEELMLDQTVTATIQAEQLTYFKFIPEKTGNYEFYSSADEDTYGFLYQWGGDSLEEIDSDDDGGVNNNFSIQHELTAGTEYYFGVRYYEDSKTGSFPVKLERYTGLIAKEEGSTWREVQLGQEETLRVIASSEKGNIIFQWMEEEDGLWSVLEGETKESFSATSSMDTKYYVCVVTDGVTEKDIRFAVRGKDEVFAQAVGNTYYYVKPGESVTLEVEASSGSGQLRYAWERCWEDENGYTKSEWIEGANQASYTVENVSQHGWYYCYVYGAIEEYRTDVYFDISVDAPVTVSSDGESTKTVSRGGTAELKVIAESYGQVTYKWYKVDLDTNKEELIEDANGAVYTVINVQESADYFCSVSNEFGRVDGVWMYVRIEGDFYVYPYSEVYLVDPGDNASLEVGYSDFSNLYSEDDFSYQWYGPVTSKADTPELIPGATGRRYEIENVQKTVFYQCQASCNGITRKCWMQVVVDNYLEIAYEGNYVYFYRGETTVLSVTASSSTGPVSYQWYIDADRTGYLESSTKIDGATSSTLEISEPVGQDITYYCVVSDIYGNTEYTSRILHVENAMSIDRSDYDQYVNIGDPITLSVTVEGYGDFSYQWMMQTYSYEDKTWSDWEEIVGQTSNSCTLENFNMQTEVECIVTSTFGSQNSAFFSLYVKNDVTIEAVGDTYFMVYPGENVTFEVEAGSLDNKYSIQWYRRVTDDFGHSGYKAIDGATEKIYTVEDVDERNYYRCEVRDLLHGQTDYVDFTIYIQNDLSAEPDGDAWITVPVGGSTTMKVKATCYTGELSYRWRADGIEDITATREEYQLNNVNQRSYVCCTVIDEYGNSTDVYFNISIDNGLTVETVGTRERHVKIGESLSLEVKASVNVGNLAYRWTKNDESDVEGASGPSIETGAINNYTSYYCTVTDDYGNSSQVEYFIYVDNGLTASAVTSEFEIQPGESLTLKVNASADKGNIKYKWYKEKESEEYGWGYWEIEGAEGTELKTGEIRQYSSYRCDVYDEYGNTEYVYFYIHIDNGFTADAAILRNFNVKIGEKAVLKVKATANAGDISYTWYERRYYSEDNWDYQPIEGANNPEFETDEIDRATSYYCRIEDEYENSENIWFYIGIENGLSAHAVTSTEFKVELGEKTKLQVEATADVGNITYTWYGREYYNEEDWTFRRIEGAHDPEFETEEVLRNTSYDCEVEDEYGNSINITFFIQVDNVFTVVAVGDTNLNVKIGGTVELEVEATSKIGDIKYTWNKEIIGSDGSWVWAGIVEDATGPNLTVTDIDQVVQYRCEVEDFYGSIQTIWFYIGIDNGLSIKAIGETERTIEVGDSVELEVEATAEFGDITYTWFKETRKSDGSWNAPILVDDVDGNKLIEADIDQVANYYCVVEDVYGNTQSIGFDISIDNGLSLIATGDTDRTVEVGGSVELEVEVSAKNGDIKYTWYKETRKPDGSWNVPIFFEDVDGKKLIENDLDQAANYNCVVEDIYGNTRSIWFYIRIENGLSINAIGETDRTVEVGGSVQMEVEATAEFGEITYAWYKEIKDANGAWNGRTRVENADGQKLTATEIEQVTNYGCFVEDVYGNTDEVWFHISIDNALNVEAVGDINLKVEYGGTAEMEVEATANVEGFKYSWYEYIVNADGSWTWTDQPVDTNGPKLAVTDITRRVNYSCIVEDVYGNTRAAWFYINIHNELTAEREGEYNRTVNPGDDVTLQVNATVLTGNITYEWYTAHRSITGVYGSSYRVNEINSKTCEIQNIQKAGEYWCVVRDDFGNYDNVNFYINIENGFTVEMVEPSTRYVEEGKSTTLAVNASCTDGEPVYRWSKGTFDSPAIGDGASLNVEAPETTMRYYCYVMDKYENMQSVVFTVVTGEIPTLELDQATNAAITVAGMGAVYSFVPETTGNYSLEANADMVFLTLFDADWNVITQEHDFGGNSDVKLEWQLVSGTQYYYEVLYLNDMKTGTIPFILTKTSSEPDAVKSVTLKYGQTVVIPEQDEFGAFVEAATDNAKVASVSGNMIKADETGTANVTATFANAQVVYVVTVEKTDDTLTLPAGLMTVEEEAFYGNTAIAFVELSDKVQMVEKNAFADSGLYQIVVAGKDTVLSESAFGDLKPTIICVEGSKAEEYAMANEFEYLYLP